MLLHLIRHGHAQPSDQDAGRPLSPAGRGDVEQLAAHLRATPAGMPATIWHSPLRRSRETAALLAQHSGRQVMLIGKSFLTPDDDPAKIARLLAELPPAADLAIVGHEPHLGALATLLVTGAAEPVKFTMDKAGALTLAPAAGKHEANGFPRWEVQAYFVPPGAR